MRLTISVIIALFLYIGTISSQEVAYNDVLTPARKARLLQTMNKSLELEFRKVMFNPSKSPSPYRALAKKLETSLQNNPSSLQLHARLGAVYFELGLKEKKRKIRKRYNKKSSKSFSYVVLFAEQLENESVSYEYFFLNGQCQLFYKNNMSLMSQSVKNINTALKMVENGLVRPKSELIFMHEKLAIYYKSIKDKSGLKKQQKIIASLKAT
jgi:hypothetical protein